MPKISIIIAAYNAEQYINRCIQSIREQSYKDFEVIVVNDGSTDSTLKILKEIETNDSRFHIFSKNNGGVSEARNFAITKSEGVWITFVDADDWIEPNYLESLYNETNDNVDIVMGNFFFNTDKLEKVKYISKNKITKKEITSYPLSMMVADCAIIDNITIPVEVLCAACCKLTRRTLINNNNITFEKDLKLNEDGLFHLKCFLKANDIIIINTPLYHYRMLSNSANNKYRPNIHTEMLIWKKNFDIISEELNEGQRQTFKDLSSYRMFLNVMDLYVNNSSYKVNCIKRISTIRNILNSNIYRISSVCKHLSTYKKIEMYFLKHKYASLLLLLSVLKKIIRK